MQQVPNVIIDHITNNLHISDSLMIFKVIAEQANIGCARLDSDFYVILARTIDCNTSPFFSGLCEWVRRFSVAFCSNLLRFDNFLKVHFNFWVLVTNIWVRSEGRFTFECRNESLNVLGHPQLSFWSDSRCRNQITRW